MHNASLENLYTKFVPVASPASPAAQRDVGLFNVFRLEDRRPGQPMPFSRQGFYKISLNYGRNRVEYADQLIDIERNTLFVTTPRVPYRWLPLDEQPSGYFCVFDEAFLLPVRGTVAPDELPIFQPGAYPVLALTEAECAAVEAIFQKMVSEITSTYAYKYDLLRAYLVELIHFVQKLQPPPAAPAHSAAARVAAQFAQLLEQQLASGAAPLRLRTARDYADALAVHVNHLNRVLKETTGRTTTALIGGRVAQEAKLLLKQGHHTVSEIADRLGFADVAHFCHFFKRQTGLTPGDFRS